MKPVDFDYQRAEDVGHAASLLGLAAGGGKLLAGGQSLGPMLNLRLVRPSILIDIRRCEELRLVEDEGDSLVIGAAITHAEIEDGTVPDPCNGWLRSAARNIAYRAIRNRGTLGGALAHADPAADWLTVLLGLDAEIIISDQTHSRAEPLKSFVDGPFSTSLGEEEVLVAVRIRKRSASARFGYFKQSVKVGEFARAFSVVLDDPERGERRAIIGAIERSPVVIDDLVGLLEDPRSSREHINATLPELGAAAKQLHAVALRRAVDALNRTGGRSS